MAKAPVAEARTFTRGWTIAVVVGPIAAAVIGVIASVLSAVITWYWVGAPSAERNELQARALSQRADARDSIDAFVRQRPGETEALQRALTLYREGRRLAGAGEYAEANGRFAATFAILEAACPRCPGVKIDP